MYFLGSKQAKHLQSFVDEKEERPCLLCLIQIFGGLLSHPAAVCLLVQSFAKKKKNHTSKSDIKKYLGACANIPENQINTKNIRHHL